MKVSKDQLTERQKVFCQMYVGPAAHVAARAARMAGYADASSHVTGCQLLQLPKVAARVSELEAAVALETGYTRERVIAEMVNAFETAKLMEEPASMISAMRQVALMSGFYRLEPQSAANDLDAQAQLARFGAMSDLELMGIIAAAGPQ